MFFGRLPKEVLEACHNGGDPGADQGLETHQLTGLGTPQDSPEEVNNVTLEREVCDQTTDKRLKMDGSRVHGWNQCMHFLILLALCTATAPVVCD